jgi:hypothetical protein
MPSIYNSSSPVTSYPNRYTSPFGEDSPVPIYSSVPIKQKISGSCLPCVICEKKDVFLDSYLIASNQNKGFGGGGAGGSDVVISITNPPPPLVFPPINPEHPTSKKYRYMILCDWDNCNMCDQNYIPYDFVVADGVEYKTASNFSLIDGITIWQSYNETEAICIFATGNYNSTTNWYYAVLDCNGKNFVGVKKPYSELITWNGGYNPNYVLGDNVILWGRSGEYVCGGIPNQDVYGIILCDEWSR